MSDHHAIIPTIELADADLNDLKETEQKILFLIAVHTVEAVSRDHVFREISVEVECEGEHFHAKGKEIMEQGWKIYEACFRNPDGIAIEDPKEDTRRRFQR